MARFLLFSPRMDAPCPWWLRWVHRRQRAADRATVWPELRAEADRRSPDDAEHAVCLALRAWAAHITAPSQRHWWCGCAAADIDAAPRREVA